MNNLEGHEAPKSHRRHDVEMSDGELADNSNKTASMPVGSHEQASNKSVRGVLGRQVNDAAAPASSEGSDSVSSYDPPSATATEDGQTPAISSQRALPAGPDESKKYKGRAPFEMRELAKGALLSLAPHNIRYSDLLAEGIDARLLSQLFEEVGLKTTPNSTFKVSATDHLLPTGPAASQTVPGKPSLATQPLSNDQPQTLISEPAVQAATAPLLSGIPSKPQTRISTIDTLASTKPAVTPLSTSPAMERKDRIAAMLAAKMGKPMPRKESPVAAPPILPANIRPPSSSTAPNPSTPHPVSLKANASSTPARSEVVESTSKTTPKAKSKAQTELVRQKMESLKRESLAKAQAREASQMLPSLSGALNGPSSDPQLSLPPKPVSQDVLTDNPQVTRTNTSLPRSAESPSVPRFTTGLTSSIPGLFMMDAEPDPVFATSVGQSQPSGPSAPLDDNEPFESEPMRVQQTTTADLDLVTRDSLGSRVLSKRPLAVDASDEQDLPPAKQQNNQPASPHGNDSASDDGYSDDISEGEIMEIDDSSPVSPLSTTARAQAFPVPLNAKPGGLNHETFSQATYPPAVTRTLGPDNHGRQSDIGGKATAAPSKLDLELEAMKKQLREAENRREAKQNGPRLRSPIASPVNGQTVAKSFGESSDAVPVATTGAVPVSTSSQPQAQQSISGTPEAFKKPLATTQSKPPAPLQVTDPLQRAKELREKLLREKLLRQKMLKQGLPELNKEVHKTQTREAEAQARLAKLRQEAEKREEEAREARRREQEIMEEVKRLEQQLEMGINGQQQFSEEMEVLDQEMAPQVPSHAQQETEIEPVVSYEGGSEAGPADDATEDSMQDTPDSAPYDNTAPGSGDSISESEGNSVRPEYNNRLVRPSAEAALPTAEEDAAFLEPAISEEIGSEPQIESQRDLNQPREASMSSGEDSPSESDDSPMEVDSDSDGSASMSDSGSDDYQPAEPIVTNDNVDSEAEDSEYDPMDAPISGAQSFQHDEDQDHYEPSETVDPLVLETTPAAAVSQTGSPVPNDSNSEREPEHGDDREHGLELTEANTLTTPQLILPSVAGTEATNDVCKTSFRCLV